MLTGRWWNIAFRTAHIAAMGVLLGGHAFDVPKSQLVPSLWATVITGVLLTISEAGASFLWLHQLRGIMTLAKLALLCAVPFLWSQRLPILLAVVVLASVGSHMSARLRYYSVLLREVVKTGSGPGANREDDED